MLNTSTGFPKTGTVTAGSLFTGTLEKFGDRAAVRCAGQDVTYRDLDDDAGRLARALAAIGAGPGRAVALMMSNRPEYLIADLAVIRCGAIKVPLNDMLSAADVDFILRDSGATVVIADSSLVSLLGPLADGPGQSSVEAVICVGGQGRPGMIAWDQFLRDAPDGDGPTPSAPDDLGLILYTGGTTGQPKGVAHTQGGLGVNLLSHVLETGLADDDRLLLTSPLPHSAGFLAQAALLRGATILLERRFDPDTVLDLIERGAVTYTFMVPTMIYRLLDRAAGRDLNGTALRTILYGAAPITRERLRQGLEVFGQVFMQFYGQSEAPNFLTRLRREDHSLDPARSHRLTSCGQPVLMAEIEITGQDGRKCEPGEIGEVIARSPYVMAGYHDRPETTARALQDGWLHTGDLGYLDEDRYLYLVDRRNDVIITGGMNVYSAEVEQFLQGCPGVRQVAVVGLPDPDWGEAVTAFVVPGADAIDEELLTRRCRAGLAAYKRPKRIVAMAELPITPVGKVDKKQLRKEHSS